LTRSSQANTPQKVGPRTNHQRAASSSGSPDRRGRSRMARLTRFPSRDPVRSEDRRHSGLDNNGSFSARHGTVSGRRAPTPANPQGFDLDSQAFHLSCREMARGVGVPSTPPQLPQIREEVEALSLGKPHFVPSPRQSRRGRTRNCSSGVLRSHSVVKPRSSLRQESEQPQQ
jgi:hypothetical protein